jgi:hypothetical protein
VSQGLIDAARSAFTQGFHLTAAVGAVIAAGIAILVAIRLRDVGKSSEAQERSRVETEEEWVLVDETSDSFMEPVPAQC